MVVIVKSKKKDDVKISDFFKTEDAEKIKIIITDKTKKIVHSQIQQELSID